MTEAELAESIYWEAEQYIPFDIQDVNLDYQILDTGTGADCEGHDGRAARRGEEGKDRRLHRRDRAGRAASPVVVDVDAFALQNAYEVNYGIEPDAVVVLLNAGASAININILSGDQSVFTRDISIGGNAYTEAVQKELNLPFESAEQLEEGHAGRRRHLRRRAAGAARDDRERAARDSEDVRLLQGDRRLRPHRPDHAERRRVARRRLRRGARTSASARRSNRSIRSRRSPSTRSKLGVDDADEARADGGGGGRPRAAKGGRPMIRINLLAAERDAVEEEGDAVPGRRRS